MATAIPQQPNPILDILSALEKGAPLFFGSGKQTVRASADPRALAASSQLAAMLETRGSSTAQVDQVIADILYRAQLAFAPVLEAEKKAGMYNTTTRNQLAAETVARATAASASAVLEDQQRALAQAAALRQTNVQAGGTKTMETGPSIGVENLIKSFAAGQVGGFALKKGKEIISKIGAPGPGYGSASDYTDIADNIYDPENLETLFADGGASRAVSGGGGAASLGFGDGGGSITSGTFTADDTAALQSIIDSATVPTISEGVQVASAEDTGTMTDAGTEGTTFAASELVFSPADVEANVVGDVDFGAALAEDGFSSAPVDPFAFDPTALSGEVGAGASAGAGLATEAGAAGGVNIGIGDVLPYAPAIINALQGDIEGAALSGAGAFVGNMILPGIGGAVGSVAGQLVPKAVDAIADVTDDLGITSEWEVGSAADLFRKALQQAGLI